ncbi:MULTISPECIES: alpha/beta hydrolase [Microbacterium]|uniref:alpha/beta hydrolase n=1 Tax=Microbacterium TaxID=33882 RepID=UPI0010F5C59E|nr:alpha/beta hydrolase-fold protein [Microbacterium sp. 4NA327F11]MCK9917053.1 alpha/beta hydrolase-fold protein [Microbacteriaceae bacterium K1510]
MSEIPSLDGSAVRYAAPLSDRGDRPVLLLLHGYGSDENDLVGLLPSLPSEYLGVSLRAPMPAPWPMSGHRWYPIDDLDGRDPAAITAAAERVLDWVDENVDAAASVGLLGFSQGAAVSLQALRLRPERFAFAVNLSGYVAPGGLPTDTELARLRPPVFWGRGARDEVIPAALVEHTVRWLPDVVALSGRVYPGLTHSVSEAELADVHAFLVARLGDIREASADPRG